MLDIIVDKVEAMIFTSTCVKFYFYLRRVAFRNIRAHELIYNSIKYKFD